MGPTSFMKRDQSISRYVFVPEGQEKGIADEWLVVQRRPSYREIVASVCDPGSYNPARMLGGTGRIDTQQKTTYLVAFFFFFRSLLDLPM